MKGWRQTIRNHFFFLQVSKCRVKLFKTINSDFVKAVSKLAKIKGKVIITGVGKSGHIASKISSTMSAPGTQSQ